jgi:hypothetical protein
VSEKACTRCGEVKPFDLFRPNPRMRLGVDSWCKACAGAWARARFREIGATPKEVPAAPTCYGCKETKPAAEFTRDRTRHSGVGLCRKCRSLKHARNMERNGDRYRAQARAANARRASDPGFVTHKRVSARVREWLGTKRGGKRTFDLLGYTLPELKAHLERQFAKGMGWHNTDEWHIDHIIPLAEFRVSGPDDPELRRAWALPNLRPLWARDNLQKRDKRTHLI